MGRLRIDLQAKLKELAPYVYFKRPPDNHMQYPCIIYRLSRPNILRANNHVYGYTAGYNVIYISRDPSETKVQEILEAFPHCGFDREYESDNLYHYSFTLYY